MTSLYAVSTTRGLNLPDGIEPDWMFQVGGDETLIIQDTKGAIYIRKAGKWYQTVELKQKKGKLSLPEGPPAEETAEVDLAAETGA